MARKTRVGILEKALDTYHFQMTLHENFDTCCNETSRVYFETIDADGKLKRVTCVIDPLSEEEKEQDDIEYRTLRCDTVLDVVQEIQTSLVSTPKIGKVVYLLQEEASV